MILFNCICLLVIVAVLDIHFQGRKAKDFGEKVTNTTKKRRDEIVAQLLSRGHVTVKETAAGMAVSDATVRRDLRALADESKCELVYGGAVLPRDSDFSFQAKSHRNVEAKAIVGQLAASLIKEDDQILIDSGTTAFEMAKHIGRKRSVSVIVNSSRLAAELAHTPGLSVVMLGGHYRPDRMDTIGPLAMTALDQLRGYAAFIGVDGLSMEFGLTASDIESAHLYRLAIKNAREAILLADHAKFQTPSLFKIVDWESVSRVVTDRKPDDKWMEFLTENGIDVIYPEQ
ncbi:MAG TPA: DeoR/GlpR transcriptional regulator [Phycisphaerae bacterium]|nr:DeoR/GlpR transcriptional regulator [Phycisphaerae bacterium]